MNKVKAFTIIEITVTMLITGIIVVLGYVCYDIISVNFRKYQKTTKQINERIAFSSLLQQDFDNAKLIFGTKKELTFNFDNFEVNYLFNDSEVVRKQANVIDTFLVSTDSIEIKINLPYSLDERTSTIPSDKIFIQEFKFNCNSILGTHKMAFKKNYAADDLLQTEESLYSDN